ncbi:hypothetical protein GCM10012289_66480 [Nonomuraea cavernae]|uniref:Uncharacterized protein n=1 Tax=Nonomuraea cavernae TaxID=2045107 RepID=A0A918DR48_9ACTN|nr:hypothetical protein GCM10012289_66480 [Nonomuraea cavernae]
MARWQDGRTGHPVAQADPRHPRPAGHVVAYDEDCAAWLPVAQTGWEHDDFAVYVWRSVRQKGDTKTVKSRRSLQHGGHRECLNRG